MPSLGAMPVRLGTENAIVSVPALVVVTAPMPTSAAGKVAGGGKYVPVAVVTVNVPNVPFHVVTPLATVGNVAEVEQIPTQVATPAGLIVMLLPAESDS